jgi:hypothetical protein
MLLPHAAMVKRASPPRKRRIVRFAARFQQARVWTGDGNPVAKGAGK